MTTTEVLAQAARLSILIVGDICLDRWCRYDPALSEPSRETGIPRTAVVSANTTPGAGGTIASNLASLSVRQITVLGVAGLDGNGYDLVEALEARGIDSTQLVRTREVPTFTYTKIINAATGIEDRPRIDFVFANPLPLAVESELLARFHRLAPAADAVIISDQAETNAGGVVTETMRQALTEIASAYPNKVILVDSRKRGELYRRVLVKVNEQEAEECCVRLGCQDYQTLRSQIDYPALLVTCGSAGALLVQADREIHVPTQPVQNPVDICGAGDSFNAGLAIALSLTNNMVQAVQFGHRIASITIMKPGTGTASPEEVLAAEAAAPDSRQLP